ncbi:MAG: hypothetical protein HYY22_03040 [Thaumarchaeota archaeon]|nr:hypothetical protein [Nitrososphaerota archaeon]
MTIGFGEEASSGKPAISLGGDDARYFHTNGIQTIRATSITPIAKTTNPTRWATSAIDRV